MSWEIGLENSPMWRPVSSFRACGSGMVLHRRQVFNSSTTSFQLRIRRLPKFRSMTQLARPRSEDAVQWAKTPPIRLRADRRSSRNICASSQFRYPNGETCMLSFRFSLRPETIRLYLISFRTKWSPRTPTYQMIDGHHQKKISVIPSASMARIRPDYVSYLTVHREECKQVLIYVQRTRSFQIPFSSFDFNSISNSLHPRIDLFDTFMQL
jgi:hypothetical protein